MVVAGWALLAIGTLLALTAVAKHLPEFGILSSLLAGVGAGLLWGWLAGGGMGLGLAGFVILRAWLRYRGV
jgi:hypothetical protein